MSKLIPVFLLLVAIGFLPTCHEISPTDKASASETPLDAGVRAYPVTFALVNNSGQDIYIQVSGGRFWSLQKEDLPLRAEENCGLCKCDHAKCIVCGVELAQTTLLAQGQRHEWNWSGDTWITVEKSITKLPIPMDCERPVPMTASDLVLTVTYSLSKRTNPPSNTSESYIGPPITIQQAFTYPSSGPVEIRVR